MEDEAGVGGVVVGDDDDGALGLGVAELADDVVGGALGQDAAQAALAGREVVGDAGGADRAQRGAEQAPAAQAGDRASAPSAAPSPSGHQ